MDNTEKNECKVFKVSEEFIKEMKRIDGQLKSECTGREDLLFFENIRRDSYEKRDPYEIVTGLMEKDVKNRNFEELNSYVKRTIEAYVQKIIGTGTSNTTEVYGDNLAPMAREQHVSLAKKMMNMEKYKNDKKRFGWLKKFKEAFAKNIVQ